MGQRDLHFYGTLCIAKAAGYSDDDAVLLAWANHETDYSLQVKWWNCPWSNLGLYFHFWPSNPKDLICRVDSELSKRIIENAPQMDAEEKGEWGYLWVRHICAIGIALHGLQDTYFHQNWIGKFSRHNVLPAWSHNKFTPTLPFPYGHTPKGKEPDIANATWYDPRTNKLILNLDRVIGALRKMARILGLDAIPAEVVRIFFEESDYDARKQKLRDLAGMPNLRFSEIRKDMLKRYGKEFRAAAKEQAKIVKDYLK